MTKHEGGQGPGTDEDGGAAFRLGPRLFAGLLLAVLLIGGIGGWAVTAQLSGAVISQGVLIVDQNLKLVQHRDGGIISEIAVQEGDTVKAGEVLMRLDDAQTRAELSIVQAQTTELTARKARLLAERDDLTDIVYPAGFTGSEDALASVEGETRLFKGQRMMRESQKKQLDLGIVQINDEIAGLDSQRSAKADEIDLVEEEHARTDDLSSRGLIEASRLYTVNRERTRLRGELGEIDAAIARARTRSSEISLQILSIDETAHTEAQRELGQVGSRLQELFERTLAIQDRLSRTDIRAPIAGTVNELNFHTTGGVISPAEVLVTIVPSGSRLKVEIRLSPVNIEQVTLDRPARLRFTSFNQRTTPELIGRISHLSPATTQDPATGERYFQGHIEIPPEELAKLGGGVLLPGMPVEVYVQTDERTVMSYLAKPVMDQFNRAFRER